MANTWKTLKPGVPAEITAPLAGVSNVINLLRNVLDVALQVASIVRSFQVGYVDPLSAILDALILEVQGMLDDLRNIGIYTTGDYALNTPFDGISGGYDAYERRMISRIVDRTDPTRPTFGPSTEVFAVFLYQSFDVSRLRDATDFLSQFRKLFGVPSSDDLYPKPFDLSVVYGQGVNPSLFSGLGQGGVVGDGACVRWRISTPPSASGTASWPVPAPLGFWVEVSTRSAGLSLAVTHPGVRGDEPTSLVDDQQGGLFQSFGGLDTFHPNPDLNWTLEGGDTYSPPSGEGAPVMLFIGEDEEQIPVNALQHDGKKLIQAAYFLNVKETYGLSMVPPGQVFQLTVPLEQMPYDATFELLDSGSVRVMPSDTPSRNATVRVIPVGFDGAPWSIGLDEVAAGAGKRIKVSEVGPMGPPSEVADIAFPAEGASLHADTITAALMILALSRSDITPSDAFLAGGGGSATGMETISNYLIKRITGPNPQAFFQRQFLDPITFRGELLRRCRVVAGETIEYQGQPSSAWASYVSDAARFKTAGGLDVSLVDVTWEDLGVPNQRYTLLSSCDTSTVEGSTSSKGVGPTPTIVGNYNRDLVVYRIGPRGVDLARTPGFTVQPEYTNAVEPTGLYAKIGTGSCDYSPVVYEIDGPKMRIEFCRNVFLRNEGILQAAQRVLGLTVPPVKGSGAWYSYKLFRQGVAPVDDALSDVSRFLSGLQLGLQGPDGAMDALINALEARVLNLEALLTRIDALLAVLEDLDVPACSGLVVRGSGMEGVLSGMVTADQKPYDSSESYGAGLVILCGGLPSLLVSIFQSLFQEE